MTLNPASTAHTERLTALHALLDEVRTRNQDAFALFDQAVRAELTRPGSARIGSSATRPPLIINRTPAHTGQLEALHTLLQGLPDDGGYRRPLLSFAPTLDGARAMAKALGTGSVDGGRRVAGLRQSRKMAGCVRFQEANDLIRVGVSAARLCRGTDGEPCPFIAGCDFQRERTKQRLIPAADGCRQEIGRDGKPVRVPVEVETGPDARPPIGHADMEMTFVAAAYHATYATQPPVLSNACGIVLNEVSPVQWLGTATMSLETLAAPWLGAVPEIAGEPADAIALHDAVVSVIVKAMEKDVSPVSALIEAYGGGPAAVNVLSEVQEVLRPQSLADAISTRAVKSGERAEIRAFVDAVEARHGEQQWHLLEALKPALHAAGHRDAPVPVPLQRCGDQVVSGYRRPFPWRNQPVMVLDESANPAMWEALMWRTHEVHVVDNPCSGEDLQRLGLRAVMYNDHSGKTARFTPRSRRTGAEASNGRENARDRDGETRRNRENLAARLRAARTEVAGSGARDGLTPIAAAMPRGLSCLMQDETARPEATFTPDVCGGPVMTYGRVRGAPAIDARGIALIGQNDPSDMQLAALALAVRTDLPSGHPYLAEPEANDTEPGSVLHEGEKTGDSKPGARRAETPLTRALLHEIREAELQLAVARIQPLRRLAEHGRVLVAVHGTIPAPNIVLTDVENRNTELHERRLDGFDEALSVWAVEAAFGLRAKSASNWLLDRGFDVNRPVADWRPFKLVSGKGGRPPIIWVRETVSDAPAAAVRHAERFGRHGQVVALERPG